MDHVYSHKQTYDAVADEYEARVNTLLHVTEEAVTNYANNAGSGKDILDIGCAVGIVIKLLKDRGFNPIGIDISPQMVTYARKRNPNLKVIEGDFLTTDFNKKFDGIIALAFIHLFSKKDSIAVLQKIWNLLKDQGILYIGTTESQISKEGWEKKADYPGQVERFRKHWTQSELKETLEQGGFKFVNIYKTPDPFGKIWMDFVVQKVNM